MDHTQFKANHTAALYVGGDLDERTQESFELHLMACSKCVDEVEIWRAMRAGLREQHLGGSASPPAEAARNGQWRLAASLAFIAIGSGAGGWYAHSLAAPPLADDSTAVFNLPPVTRGFAECESLPVEPQTELVALRVPNAATGWRLELTDERGQPLDQREYAVRTQSDGSWLLRMRAVPHRGELLRLQTRAADGSTEPLGCLVIPASS